MGRLFKWSLKWHMVMYSQISCQHSEKNERVARLWVRQQEIGISDALGKAEKLVLVREMVLSHLRSQSDSSRFILSQCCCIWSVLLLRGGGLTVLSFLSVNIFFFLTCRKSWLDLSWFEMIQIRLKMAGSLWSQKNEIDGHQSISHMFTPSCSFRRLGNANKCTSNTDLPGLEEPLAVLQLKLWDRHHKAANLPPALHRLWQHPQTASLPSHLWVQHWQQRQRVLVLPQMGLYSQDRWKRLSFIKFIFFTALNSIKAKWLDW